MWKSRPARTKPILEQFLKGCGWGWGRERLTEPRDRAVNKSGTCQLQEARATHPWVILSKGWSVLSPCWPACSCRGVVGRDIWLTWPRSDSHSPGKCAPGTGVSWSMKFPLEDVEIAPKRACGFCLYIPPSLLFTQDCLLIDFSCLVSLHYLSSHSLPRPLP